MWEPRGARGTPDRLRYDFLAGLWNEDVLNGNFLALTVGQVACTDLYCKWADLAEQDESLQFGSSEYEEALGYARRLFRLCPMIAIHWLNYGCPAIAGCHGKRLFRLGEVHRQIEGKHSVFGDEFGVSLFRGSRISNLAWRHQSHDPDTIVRCDEVSSRLLSVLTAIEGSRRLVEMEHMSPFPVHDPIGQHKEYVEVQFKSHRYGLYRATVFHDIVRAYCKSHLFGPELSTDQLETLDKMHGQFKIHYDSIFYNFREYIRDDTLCRYTLVKGKPWSALVAAKAAIKRFPGATIAEMAINMETQLLCCLAIVQDEGDEDGQPGLDIQATRKEAARFLGRVILELRFASFARNLDLIAIKYGLYES